MSCTSGSTSEDSLHRTICGVVLLLTGAEGARILRRLLGFQAERIAAEPSHSNGGLT